jgi:hypothetical protein
MGGDEVANAIPRDLDDDGKQVGRAPAPCASRMPFGISAIQVILIMASPEEGIRQPRQYGPFRL